MEVESQWHEVIRWRERERDSGVGKKKSLSHEWLEIPVALPLRNQ